VDPARFPRLNKVGSYAGLGLGGGVTNCLPGVRQGSPWGGHGRPGAGRGSKGRVLFIAAEAAIKGSNALQRRYQSSIASGWERKKAIRDDDPFVTCACLSTDRRS
jgi:hypothetical protein